MTSGHPRDLTTGAPVVVFTGQGPRSRPEYVDDSIAHGWRVTGAVIDGVDVVVRGTSHSRRKLRAAEKRNVPVVTYARWESLMRDGEIPRRAAGHEMYDT